MQNLKRLLVLLTLVHLGKFEEEISILDELLLPIFRPFRKNLQISILEQNRRNLAAIPNNLRLQPVVPKTTSFPCLTNETRSREVPDSVHKLRPGDIDIVGAIGDSLTVGFGLMATNLVEVAMQNRGASFTIGGEKTWREFLTLPNILKEFNPNLFGYSLESSISTDRASQFNVAEGGAVSKNTPYMTKVLIKRIKKDKRVNITRDWKMITYMIGGNDFCIDMCYHHPPENILKRHEKDLVRVLRLLRDNLPRTIVNVVPPPSIRTLVELKSKPPFCEFFVLRAECPCFYGNWQFDMDNSRLYRVMKKWQAIDERVSSKPEFDSENFTVVFQPFLTNYKVPKNKYGHYDSSLFSADCFHFSQKGNARVANDLWNNIMEPVGQKSTTGDDMFKKFHCPTAENPYIYTRRNSG